MVTPADILAYQREVLAHPVGFIKEALGVDPWSKQIEIIEAMRDHKLVAVRSANSMGKTVAAALLTIMLLQAHCPYYVIITSASWTNVIKSIWPDIRATLKNAPYYMGPDPLSTEWNLGEKYGAFSVSTNKPENFMGYHTPNGVAVIVDEASALEPAIYEAIMGLITTEDSRLLLIGNPLRPSGPFFDAFSKPNWHKIHISAFDSPNVKAGRTVIPGLATREWVEERKEEWGEDSPAYQARVLGEFPLEGEDTLIQLAWVMSSMQRHIDGEEVADETRGVRKMGVDVARFGGDRTVFVIRDDREVLHMEHHTKKDTMWTVGKTLNLMKEWDIDPWDTFIDDTGLGGGVTDRLHEQEYDVVAVIFGGGADDQERFANIRAECHWGMRDALNPDRTTYPLLIPKRYEALAMECTVPHKGYKSNGQIKIEKKEDIKKRLRRSPDLGDALALTYTVPQFQEDFVV